METELRAGRLVGALFLAQMAGSIVVNLILTAPLFGEPGFLVSAAAHSQQIGLSALLGLALGAAFLATAITTFPLVRRHSQGMALWLVALGAVNLAVAVFEQAGVMSMVSLSEGYAKANLADRASFLALRGVVASARNWPHFMGRLADGAVLFVFYAALFRFALIPRVLAALGIGAVLLQLTSIGMPFFGHKVVFPLLAPLGVCQLLVALWLLAKGFRRELNPAIATG